jgi:hypothetical protein
MSHLRSEKDRNYNSGGTVHAASFCQRSRCGKTPSNLRVQPIRFVPAPLAGG